MSDAVTQSSHDASENQVKQNLPWLKRNRHVLRAGRPIRWFRRKWQERKITGTLIWQISILLFGPGFIVMLCYLLSGSAESRNPFWQSGFVLMLGILGIILSTIAWASLKRVTQYAYYWILCMGTLFVLFLTQLGYWDCIGERTPIFTQIYYGLQLLIGEIPKVPGGETCSRESLIIQVAQYTAVAILFAAVIKVVAEITSHHFAHFKASFASKVILVTGLNDDSLLVIKSLVAEAEGALVVVVEPNPDHPLLPQVRKLGTTVIVGEISNRKRDKKWLKRMATYRNTVSLRRVYLLDNDDYANVVTAEIVQQVLSELHECYHQKFLPPTRIIVRLDRFQQARYYNTRQVKAWDSSSMPRAFIATLGKTQLTAHALVQYIVEQGKPTRTIVVGNDDMSEAFRQEWDFQQKSAKFLAQQLQSFDSSLVTGSDHAEQSSPLRTMLEFQEAKTQLAEPEYVNKIPEIEELKTQAERICVVLTGSEADYSITELEHLAESLKGKKIRIFVPRSGTKGIAEIPMLGCLHFYGLTLGGFDREHLKASKNLVGKETEFFSESPLVGVPQDSWFRAAKLINDGYSITSGKTNTWENLHLPDKESNFRAIWHTLMYLAQAGFEWVSVKSLEYEHAGPDAAILEKFMEKEHGNWYAFKRYYGWVGVPSKELADSRFLENCMLYSWKDLENYSDLQESCKKAKQNSLLSIDYNIRALEALGYYAQRKL